MKLLGFVFRDSPWLLAGSLAVGVAGGAASAALLAVINGHLTGSAASLAVSAWSFAALVLVTLVTSYLSRALVIRLSQQASFDLRMSICRQALATPLRELEERGGHQIMATLTQDVNNVAQALVGLPPLCINAAIVVGCAVYLGWLSPPLLGVLAGYLVLAVISVQVPEHFASRALRKARESWDVLVKEFRALTEGVKELKLIARRRRAFLAGPLEGAARSYRERVTRSSRIYAASNSWSQVLYFLFIGVILFAVPAFAEVSLAVLTGYTITALYMRGPIVALLDLVPVLGRARVSLGKIESLGLEPAAGPEEPELPPRAALERIELRGVTHRYYREREERDFELGPIDLSLGAGELVFLAGGNGSGKTTLAKLVMGLYVPEQGEILLDGVPITDGNREWYRQHFSVVFSDFFLFDSLLGIDPAEPDGGLEGELDRRAREYLERLEIDHKVAVRDGVLSTTSLSQGQRRRLALLTAYLDDNPVFVFDEWAADQDPAFKRVFYLELLPELRRRGKAVLVITHDDRYFEVADRVHKLDYGKLVPDDAPAAAAGVEPALTALPAPAARRAETR